MFVLDFQNYQKAVLSTMAWIALLICASASLIFILILSDHFFEFHWGYPWWSAVAVLAFAAASMAVRQMIVTALKHDSDT